ncbi:hypothetical protein F4779DRAFT_614800 [Xylariaceae sp. FL0662B]|nr:hypothetical protein F4779DRAFT_614800 [Xylariaceae sp. FL0662B]
MFRAQVRRTVRSYLNTSSGVSQRASSMSRDKLPPVKVGAKRRGFEVSANGYAGSYQHLEDLNFKGDLRWATSPPRNHWLGLPGMILSALAESEKVILGAIVINGALYGVRRESPRTIYMHFSHTPMLGKNYTLLTSTFGHSGLRHVLLNLFGLVQFTPIVAQSSIFEGSGSRLTAFLLSSGTIANLGDHLTSVWPRPMGRFRSGLGASGMIMAVLGAWTMVYPDVRLIILFIPGSWPAQQLLVAVALVELYGVFEGIPFLRIGHGAHLAGLAVGSADGRFSTPNTPIWDLGLLL